MGYKLKRILIYPDGVTEKQVYPAFKLKKIFDFSTSDTHGFTKYNMQANGLTIDTSNQWCTNTVASGGVHGYGSYYKQVNYKKCWQRIKGRITTSGALVVGLNKNYSPASGFTGSLSNNGSQFAVGIPGEANYKLYSFPSGFDMTQYYYYDVIFDNGTITTSVLDLNENVLWTATNTSSVTTQTWIGFSGGAGPNANLIFIKEYRLAYEE